MNGVDISHYQRGLTIQQLKDSGKSFAIIKLTEGTHLIDASSFEFYQEAYQLSFPLGCYCYSHATNAQQAMAEAVFLLDTLRGFPMPCGIFLDMEEPKQLALPHDDLLNVIRGWCAGIGGKGYIPGIYSSEGTLWAKISPEELPDGCLVWVARWSNNQPNTPCDLWQNSDRGQIDGYNGPVDTDVALSDRFQYLINTATYKRTEEKPAEYSAPDACPIQATDPVISVLQLLMSNKGYWGTNFNGQKSEEFFNNLQQFVDDLKKQ